MELISCSTAHEFHLCEANVSRNSSCSGFAVPAAAVSLVPAGDDPVNTSALASALCNRVFVVSPPKLGVLMRDYFSRKLPAIAG